MSIELSPETESRIAKAIAAGRFSNPRELVETAVKSLLDEPEQTPGKFHLLRKRVEESGIPLLSDDELREEMKDRRGRCA
jgi:Arc/MetJ-type ribon-helix-helix transcriptional regulator